ncbi:2OG-Fe(II) oxygenase [Streptomyces cinerochromogenes]|uniref:2OG-Fe(II) oxygenase n=1 Tax=Streptomyces cinerochromogenes TaxID=66422 RepID=A0ABW7B4Y7_9ACTN
MELTFKSEMFAIFDDVLTRVDLDALRKHFREGRFSHISNFRARSRVFGILDGDPLVGPSVVQHHPTGLKGATPYPAGNAIDALVQALDDNSNELVPWTGTQGVSWDFFTCTPYLYPVGSGLSWHDDAEERSASYVFYLHDDWRASWGAELLIGGNGDVANRAELLNGMPVPSVGSYVMPHPNRLVVIKSGTPHAVKRVDVTAGENIRMSIAGFFQQLS